MPSINEASTVFRAILDEGYAEGVHDGLLIARDTAKAAQDAGKDPVRYLSDALAYFEEHRP